VVVYRTQGDGSLHYEAETCAPAVASAQQAGATLPLTEVQRSQILESSALTPDTPLAQYFTTLGVETATVVPIVSGPGHIWGVLMVHHPPQTCLGNLGPCSSILLANWGWQPISIVCWLNCNGPMST
jgi:hypothetical protein